MSYIKEFFIGIFGYYENYMFFSVIGVVLLIFFTSFFIFHKPQEFKKFKSLEMHKIIWRWSWKGKNVVSLWCYCPVCGSSLLCDDEYSRSNIMLANKTTFFICKTCGDIEKSKVVGGDRNYVMKIVRLEISKRVKSGNF